MTAWTDIKIEYKEVKCRLSEKYKYNYTERHVILSSVRYNEREKRERKIRVSIICTHVGEKTK